MNKELISKLKNANAQLVIWLILGLGVILIIIALSWCKGTTETVVLSVGTSILATGIVSLINLRYMIRDTERQDIIEDWGLSGIYKARAQINEETNEILKKADSLDIVAMGLKGFRDAQADLILDRIKQGMKLRILTIDPNSRYLAEIDATERVAEGSTKTTIEGLILWVEQLKAEANNTNQIELRVYDHYPYDFYFKIDDIVFTGPYHSRTSQQTLTYKFDNNRKGSQYYGTYFEELWRQYER